MPTLLYSPAVRVLIDSEKHGIVDVSDDLRDGSLSLRENASSTFEFALINHRRKYDGIFAPNDRIHVQMKRVTWVPLFSGYLDEVPYFSVYPRVVPMKAQCTLKRLKHRYWDPGADASVQLLRDVSGGDARLQQDGGLRDKVLTLLTNVADWPEQNIHYGRIPDDWAAKFEPLREQLQDEFGVATMDLGQTGSIQGSNPASIGTRFKNPEGPGTGTLPQFRGKVTVIDSINRELELTAPERGGPGNVGSGGFNDEWYITMRWPYRQSTLSYTDPESKYLTDEETTAAKNWWKERRILLVNPKNNRAVVLRPVDWGPDVGSGNDIGVSSHVLQNVLRLDEGGSVEVRYTKDDNYPLGAVDSGPAAADVTAFNPADPLGQNSPGVFAASPDRVESASGLRWVSAENLKPHVNAARQFIKNGWAQTGTIGGYADRTTSTGAPSDHKTGTALDVHVCTIGQEPTPEQIAFGNSVAQWFVANPNVFTVKYVIWRDKINTGTGWRTYFLSDDYPQDIHASPTQGHRDHVHISFENVAQTEPGAMGSPWPGANESFLQTTVFSPSGVPQFGGVGAGFGGVFGSSGPLLGGSTQWVPQPNAFSEALTGPRALLNDVPVYETISKLTSASMRSHMAAPNGDFIAWFPDYFGQYGTAGRMIVRDIEIANQGFTVVWNDENLVTHQYVAGTLSGYLEGATFPGGEVTFANQMATQGIATVEFPELMEALFNISDPNDDRAKYFRDPEAILQRFGARVNYQPINLIAGPAAEFWFAVRLFMRAWASQFSSSVELTFMPEIYPGMLLRFEGLALQGYVTSVRHSFDFGGSGFKTTASIIAPSATDGSGLYGLPLAGDVPKGGGGGGGGRNLIL